MKCLRRLLLSYSRAYRRPCLFNPVAARLIYALRNLKASLPPPLTPALER